MATYDSFLGNSTPLVGFEARGNFTDQDDIRDFFANVNATDAMLLRMGKRCLETDGSFLKYMGTVRQNWFYRTHSDLCVL